MSFNGRLLSRQIKHGKKSNKKKPVTILFEGHITQDADAPERDMRKTNREEGLVSTCRFSSARARVFVAPVVSGVAPSFSIGELQGHLAYDLNQALPQPVNMRRTLASTSSSG